MRSIVTWFIDNPIAAKLAMFFILIAGLMTFPLLDKEFFPQIKIDLIKITVPYPGAGPEEVEKQICARIEEAVQQLGGIEEIRSVAREGFGEVIIEVKPEEDTIRILNDVKANVEAINTFPAGSERPQIVEQRFRNTILRLQLAGDLQERELKELGEQIREELAALPSVAIAEIRTPRNYEVGIEISETALRDYGLTFDEVAAAVRGYSFNMPAGKIRDSGGDILLQTRAQADYAEDFNQIPLRRNADGALLRVGDVAKVVDGFEDVDIYSTLDGLPSLEIWIRNQSNPDILRTSSAVKAYVEQKSEQLPDAVSLSIWSDASVSYRGRLDTLIYNGSSGLLLVFIILLIFLRPSLAFWVCSGIAVAFMGAIWWLSFTSVSLNIISMFAFIMILGIVVDDAIIVGEAIYTEQMNHSSQRQGAIEGVMSVIAPVWFAVISTMIFFVPFFFIGDGPEPATIATPVILALVFSLFESLFLLPSHLADKGGVVVGIIKTLVAYVVSPFSRILHYLEQRRLAVAALLPLLANTSYRRLLVWTVGARKLTIVVFCFLFIFAVATVKGGWLPFSFFPRVTSDYVVAKATLPEAAPFNQIMSVANHLELSAQQIRTQVNAKYGYELVKGIHVAAYATTARITLLLEDGNDRPIGSDTVARQLQEQIGEMQGLKDLSVSYTIFDIPKPIEFVVRSDSQQQLEEFSAALALKMATIEGVFNVGSTLDNPSNEINLQLKPEADTLAVNLASLSQQVRRAFYGEEVQRIPRLREDVKVLVRYPRADRSYEEALREMYISSGRNGALEDRVPLSSLVDIEYRKTYKKVERLDRKRVARVSSDVQRGFNAGAIIQQLQTEEIDALLDQYPDVVIALKGEQQENDEFFQELVLFLLLSMMGIFAVMAIMFRSYWQPLLVLTAVPFGFMGAIYGHLIIGVNISMFSVLGMMACAGVVVNDNVVLIDRINQLRRLGFSPRRAVVNGAVQRFRPIVLTSVTTFFGLTPILLESSVQAQFLIPMVTSLSFGVLFASVVTLIFVPALYLAGENASYYFAKRQARLDAALADAAALNSPESNS